MVSLSLGRMGLICSEKQDVKRSGDRSTRESAKQ